MVSESSWPKLMAHPPRENSFCFSRMSFPPGTIGGRYFGQGKWSDVSVFRDGCVPDGKCDSIADGKVWIDLSDMPDTGSTPTKRLRRKTARQQTSAAVVHVTSPVDAVIGKMGTNGMRGAAGLAQEGLRCFHPPRRVMHDRV
jgi:hypothetical protein